MGQCASPSIISFLDKDRPAFQDWPAFQDRPVFQQDRPVFKDGLAFQQDRGPAWSLLNLQFETHICQIGNLKFPIGNLKFPIGNLSGGLKATTKIHNHSMIWSPFPFIVQRPTNGTKQLEKSWINKSKAKRRPTFPSWWTNYSLHLRLAHQ